MADEKFDYSSGTPTPQSKTRSPLANFPKKDDIDTSSATMTPQAGATAGGNINRSGTRNQWLDSRKGEFDMSEATSAPVKTDTTQVRPRDWPQAWEKK